MSRDREYEVKFAIDPGDAEQLVSHSLLAPALRGRRVSRLVSTYFDTPDATLRRHRVSLRVRHAEEGTSHTLKRAGGSLIDREEWEHESGALQPDIAWLQASPLGSLFKRKDVADALDPQFTVDVTRTTFPLCYQDAEIEGALDQGTIRAKGLSLLVSEFELESETGRPEAVLDLARVLVADLPLGLSLASKAERGYGVVDLTWGQPTKELALDLADEMTMAQAFEAITQACLHTLSVNAALIRSDEDVEAVHKARIALRHLRAAFQLFGPKLRRKRAKTLRRDMKWISQKLGVTRDGDVFQAEIFDPAASEEILLGASALAEFTRHLRGRAHAKLRRALASSRWRLLLLDLLAFSTEGVRRSDRRDRYRPFVRRRLAKRRRSLARSAAGLTALSPSAMHEVRKAAKMFRYALDFFKDVPKLGARAKSVHRLRDDLQTLQQTLGALHDQDAMRDHLREAFFEHRAPVGTQLGDWKSAAFAAGVLSARPIARDKALRRAGKAARRVAATKAF